MLAAFLKVKPNQTAGSLAERQAFTVLEVRVVIAILTAAEGHRTYASSARIVNPPNTWGLIDEHPDSINDAAFANEIGLPAAVNALIVNFPASYHGGASGIAFAHENSEIHKCKGSKIKLPVTGKYMTNVPASDSVDDLERLSGNTTVR